MCQHHFRRSPRREPCTRLALFPRPRSSVETESSSRALSTRGCGGPDDRSQVPLREGRQAFPLCIGAEALSDGSRQLVGTQEPMALLREVVPLLLNPVVMHTPQARVRWTGSPDLLEGAGHPSMPFFGAQQCAEQFAVLGSPSTTGHGWRVPSKWCHGHF